MHCSGRNVATTPSGCRWGGWGSCREALSQELYGEDLVTAMTNRVNFTVNHYHQVKDPWAVRVKYSIEDRKKILSGVLPVVWMPQCGPLGCYQWDGESRYSQPRVLHGAHRRSVDKVIILEKGDLCNFSRSKMFKLAKSISPDTLFFLNDYGIIMDRWFTPTFLIALPQKWSVCLVPTANKGSSGRGRSYWCFRSATF